MGLKADDPKIAHIITQIVRHRSPEGPFQLPMNISAAYGGDESTQWAWALCDAPLVVYALIKFGLEHEPVVQTAVEYLIGLVRENGWPCAVANQLGNFRGPGRKDDPCPFANLAMLKALAASSHWQDSPSSHSGAETLLTL